MKLSTLRRRGQALSGVTGTARVDRRTKNLARRAERGDVAIIDHVDIDRSAAVALVEAGVAAVVNAAPSVSGRYPNLGPEVLLRAGIVLVDDVGGAIFAAVGEGDEVRVDGDTIYCGDTEVASGQRQDIDAVALAAENARDGLSSQLGAFGANAVEHLRHEQDLLLDGDGVPQLSLRLRDRNVLVVSREFDYTDDLRSLRTFIKETNPVLIGVEGGADALIEAGHRPDVVVCDGNDVSDTALRCGAEIVVRAGRDGWVSGGDRIERLGVRHTTFPTGATTEDAALLLAHAQGAALIVLAGSFGTLEEFVDRGRSSMASAFLTRTTVGPRLVDASAVAALYRHRVRGWLVFVLVLLALACVGAALATTPVGQDWWQQIHDWYWQGYDWVRARI